MTAIELDYTMKSEKSFDDAVDAVVVAEVEQALSSVVDAAR